MCSKKTSCCYPWRKLIIFFTTLNKPKRDRLGCHRVHSLTNLPPFPKNAVYHYHRQWRKDIHVWDIKQAFSLRRASWIDVPFPPLTYPTCADCTYPPDNNIHPWEGLHNWSQDPVLHPGEINRGKFTIDERTGAWRIPDGIRQGENLSWVDSTTHVYFVPIM